MGIDTDTDSDAVTRVKMRDVLGGPGVERQRQFAVARFEERPVEVSGVAHRCAFRGY